ncbi:hypothetical protein DID78_01635 [Candidatus Marinamargulisbacteria bacterium SCGC AG-343-D04]|nr:hypothetical protein DID78_01635 [Candidatus Marinamargulisbacteria bacterium SCGC AG-343-D04]
MRKKVTYFNNKKTIVKITIALFLFIHPLHADISNITTSSGKKFTPPNTETAIIFFKLNTDAQDIELTSITLESSGSDLTFLDNSYKSIKIYEDLSEGSELGDNQFDSSIDRLIDEETSFDTQNPIVFQIQGGQKISSSNVSGFGHFVVVEMSNKEENFGKNSSLSLSQITAKDTSTTFVADTVFTTSFQVTGLSINANFDIAPSVIFPGQDDVAPVFISITPKGEDVENFNVGITDSFSNFISNNDTKGVVKVDLYSSDDDSNSSFDIQRTDQLLLGKTLPTVTFSEGSTTWSDNNILLKYNETIPSDNSKSFWPIYSIGSDIPVSKNTFINVTLSSLFGKGSSSNLDVTGVTQNQSITIPVAGVTATDIKNETPDSPFGKNSIAAVLSFKLQSYQSETVINKIDIHNTGSIPFNTNTFTENGKDIKKIEIYQDAPPGNESFSIILDTLVGSLECFDTSFNSNTKAPITMNITVSTYNEVESYPENNEAMLFVVYHFGSDLSDSSHVSGNFSNASIGNIFVSGNYTIFDTIKTVEFKGSNSSSSDLLSSTPTASITLTDSASDITITSINILSPDVVYKGQNKVPMLYFEINSDVITETGEIVIKNGNNNFAENNTSISRIWAFEDSNSNGTFDSTDLYLSSTTDFSESTLEATLKNVKIDSSKKILILYSFGMNCSSEMLAQIDSFNTTDETLTPLGSFPSPETPAQATPINAPLNGNNVDVDLSISNLTDPTVTFNITITLQNTSDTDITIDSLSPKILLNDISGLDITHEFNFFTSQTFPFEIPANTLDHPSIVIETSHFSANSSGLAIVDASINYHPTNETNDILLERSYSGSSWEPVTQTDLLTLKQEIPDEILPSYIKLPLGIHTGGNDFPSAEKQNLFFNNSGIEAGSKLIITLQNPSSIDESNLKITKGALTLIRKSFSDIGENSYYYEPETGIIAVDVGKSSNTIGIEAKDLHNNTFPSAFINYLISETTELTSPLFYPNPYIMGSGTLTLGFSITQPSDVSIYIYNYIGILVHEDQESFTSSGWNTFSFASESFLVPGMYLCKIVARDNNTSSVLTTKLAIY